MTVEELVLATTAETESLWISYLPTHNIYLQARPPLIDTRTDTHTLYDVGC